MDVLVKKIIQRTWDYDYDNGIGNYFLEKLHKGIHNYLNINSAESISQVKNLPYLQEGIISGPKIKNAYKLGDCIIGLDFSPIIFSGYGLRLMIVGPINEARTIEQEIKSLSEWFSLYTCVAHDLYKKAKKESYHEQEEVVIIKDNPLLEDYLKYLSEAI